MKFSGRLAKSKSSIIRDILKLLYKPGLISFAGGMPAPEIFPVEDISKLAAGALKENGTECLQYSISEGLKGLREELSKFMAGFGQNAAPDELIITSGAQQGLDLAGKLLLDKGDTVFIEEPGYLGAIQAFNMFESEFEPIPMESDGMSMQLLEKKLKKITPKLIYTVPDFQNPTGITMSLAKRKKLLSLAYEYDIPIIEDSPYSYIRFENRHIPSLASLDEKGVVISLGSFSKIISPGLRLGWISAKKDIASKILLFKQATDLHCSTLTQKIAEKYLSAGKMLEHIEKIKQVYKHRRDVMAAAIEKSFPKGSKYIKSEGGLFIWVELPAGFNTGELFYKAVENGVAYVPGSPFYIDGSGANTLRLNFSNSSPEDIKTGINKLGKLFTDELEKK